MENKSIDRPPYVLIAQAAASDDVTLCAEPSGVLECPDCVVIVSRSHVISS